MTLNFSKIELADQAKYNRHFDACDQTASDYTFTNLWGWAEEYDLSWAWDNQLVWLKQNLPTPCYWAPVGNWHGIDWQTKLAPFHDGLPFVRIPENLALIWQTEIKNLNIKESREHWDYIYNYSDLIELKGNKFHKKKNLLHQFQKQYNFRYLPLKGSLIKKALLLQEDWCIWKNCEASAGLLAENLVIERVLQKWSNLERLRGGVILIDDEMAAFTVGELVRPNTMVIHIEKGLGSYKGIYQAINQLFLAGQSGIAVVNREQDLGNEGLRKAKLSYNPISFIKKFTMFL